MQKDCHKPKARRGIFYSHSHLRTPVRLIQSDLQFIDITTQHHRQEAYTGRLVKERGVTVEDET
ncbi:hypothetical protein NBRC116494_35540 [Aurantivibrio plasticivorans]